MPKKTIFEEKETGPFLSGRQRNILFKFFIIFCFIRVIGVISYFSFWEFGPSIINIAVIENL